jgi:hypothetical protein
LKFKSASGGEHSSWPSHDAFKIRTALRIAIEAIDMNFNLAS